MSQERRIEDHVYVPGNDGYCAHSWVTHGSGTETEWCNNPQEKHDWQPSHEPARIEIHGMPIEEQEALADAPFFPVWLDPVTSSVEDREAERVAAGIDRRPHSRACGISQHPHGKACSSDCPTCHGQEQPEPAPFAESKSLTVAVYTTDEPMEQPYIIHHVTALTVVAGLLTIECDVKENDYTFSAHHRYLPNRWNHFEVSRG